MPLNVLLRRIKFRLQGKVVHLYPNGKSKGNVLLSYTTLPYLDRRPSVLDAHTNRWESMQIAQTFLDRNYAVDIMDWTDTHTKPHGSYAYFIDVGANMERLAPTLPKNCTKIFHITGAHWIFQNTAEYSRLLDLQHRRGVTLLPRRTAFTGRSIEHADIATVLGNDFTAGTYAYAGKPAHYIPLSTTHTFPSPANKDFTTARTQFLWLGGAGSVHKGLDITLEAFANMPECQLVVCGKIDPDFEEEYRKELYHSSNIRSCGWLNPGSQQFKDICEKSIAIVHPSCSEGQSGSVILATHAGLLPIVSRESGVDTFTFGHTLPHNTIEDIISTVREVASSTTEALHAQSVAAWEYAQHHHTRSTFADAWRKLVDQLDSQQERHG